MNAGETASVGQDCQRKWDWVVNVPSPRSVRATKTSVESTCFSMTLSCLGGGAEGRENSHEKECREGDEANDHLNLFRLHLKEVLSICETHISTGSIWGRIVNVPLMATPFVSF